MIESPKRIRTRMLGLYELTRSATVRTPSGVAKLHDVIRHLDGFSPIASGSGSEHGGGGELTSVESAAHRRLGDLHPGPDGRMRPGPTLELERISHLITEATRAIHDILTIIDNVGDPPKAQSSDMCVGGVGYEWWVAPPGRPDMATCQNVQEKGRASGLCASCRARRQRWGQ